MPQWIHWRELHPMLVHQILHVQWNFIENSLVAVKSGIALPLRRCSIAVVLSKGHFEENRLSKFFTDSQIKLF